MALIDDTVADLLSRVQKLESQQSKHEHEEYKKYLGALDRAMLSMTIALDTLSNALIEKNIVTKEELEKLSITSRDRILNEVTDQSKNPGT